MEHLKAVGIDPAESAEKARIYLRSADEIGKRTERRAHRSGSSKLPPSFFTKQEIANLILAAESFRVCGEHHWFDSANAYGRSAFLHAGALHEPKNAAQLFLEAAIVMEKIDTNFANEYYRKAVSQHCDAAQYNEAALIQERIAANFHRKGDDTVSIEEYHRASKLYSVAKMTDDADRTLEKAAYLSGSIGKYEDCSAFYQSLAIRHTHDNIKKFHAPTMMLRGTLLLIHDCLLESDESDLSTVIEYVESMYSLDCRFSESPEHDFIVDMIQCIRHGDLDVFADCVYSFNEISDLDELMLMALNGIKEGIISVKTTADKGESTT